MLSAYEVEQQFLVQAGSADGFLSIMAEAYTRAAPDMYANLRRFLMASVNEYLLAVRKDTITWYCTQKYGGLLQAPSDFEALVNPSREKLMELNAICGYYGADRTVIHVYLDAYLRKVTHDQWGPLGRLDSLVRDLKTATA